MNEYTKKLHSIWKSAVERYEAGEPNSEKFFTDKDIKFFASCGMRAHEMFDYAKNYADYAEPDFPCTVLIQDVRRSYFLEVQKGIPSENVLDKASVPSKNQKAKGIAGLPRILLKARAMLRGELPKELMYCCGGDRRFCKKNNIHPAELLRAVWFYEDDNNAIVNWVAMRAKETTGLFNEIKKLPK